jgi:hypothetical protein
VTPINFARRKNQRESPADEVGFILFRHKLNDPDKETIPLTGRIAFSIVDFF